MMLFIDTSVWSLALQRVTRVRAPEVEILRQALDRGEQLTTTGPILQEFRRALGQGD